MGQLSLLQMLVFVFSPMAVTGAIAALVAWLQSRRRSEPFDGPERLLSAAIRQMPAERSEWGEAMMSELIHLHARGEAFRWCFALGCARAALFPPATGSWVRHAVETLRRLATSWAVLSVAMPTLSLPLLWVCAVLSNAFMTHDNFSSGEIVPTLLGAAILGSLVLMFSGLPLGFIAWVRRDQHRWLSLLGPAQSMAIFGYLQIVQHFANH